MEPQHIDPALTAAESRLPGDEASLLDVLSQQRQAIADTKETQIELTGYRKAGVPLYAKYRLLDGTDLRQIGIKVSKEFRNPYDQQLYASVDTIARACIGFVYQHPDTGEFKDLTLDGEPITGYNDQLAKALNIKVNDEHPVRSIVMAMFGDNEIMVVTHNVRLGRWMSDTSSEVDSDFLPMG